MIPSPINSLSFSRLKKLTSEEKNTVAGKGRNLAFLFLGNLSFFRGIFLFWGESLSLEESLSLGESLILFESLTLEESLFLQRGMFE